MLAAFLIGSIPAPWVIAKVRGRGDVIAMMRRKDSPGDAHFLVSHHISKTSGVLAMTFDVFKGLIPAVIAVRSDVSTPTLAFVGVAGVSGHSFAPFLRSAGGRGLTTAAGVSFAIIPWAMFTSGFIAFLGTITKRGGQGTGIGFYLLPLFAFLVGYEAGLVAMAGGIAALIALRRLEGIEEDLRDGISGPRAFVSRIIFDLPRGRRS